MSDSTRMFNFSAGPATLPLSVLQKAQADLLCLPGAAGSILEISHRSPQFIAIMDSALARLRRLLAVPDTHEVLLMQGGSRLLFSAIPMNLMPGSREAADYVVSGSWSAKAIGEAKKEGPVRQLWSGKEHNFDRLPDWSELEFNDAAPFAYIASNETIQGIQFPADLDCAVPLACDCSSDFLSRPIPIEKYGIVYACAQKNAGPAGVTAVIIRKDLLDRGSDQMPGYMLFRNHVENGSMYNTPPTFAIYLLDLVCEWLEDEVGGLGAIEQRNQAKAARLYDVIDGSDGFYSGHAQPACRSMMNVTFRLEDADLEKAFVAGAADHNIDGIKGHRSVGGIRASIYNAMSMEGVEALAQYMQAFRESH